MIPKTFTEEKAQRPTAKPRRNVDYHSALLTRKSPREAG